MVKLTRKSDRRNIVAGRRTFFAGCKTYMDQPFFQAKNEAELFIDVLRTSTLAGQVQAARIRGDAGPLPCAPDYSWQYEH